VRLLTWKEPEWVIVRSLLAPHAHEAGPLVVHGVLVRLLVNFTSILWEAFSPISALLKFSSLWEILFTLWQVLFSKTSLAEPNLT